LSPIYRRQAVQGKEGCHELDHGTAMLGNRRGNI